jgi:SPP1 gp7 family putative phage head morphogenesis protein
MAGTKIKKYSSLGKAYQRQKLIDVKGKKPFYSTELAINEEAIYKRMKLVPYSPDKLLSKKKIDIFNEMMTDDEISAAVDELKLLRLSKGWEIEAASDSSLDRQIRDEVEYNLENIEGSFDDDLREMMGALEMGVSVNEMVWNPWEKGKYAGTNPHIRLQSIKSLNPKYLNLFTDDFNNILQNGVVNISSLGYGDQYPVDKFIIYSFNKKYENIWGTSRIRELYDLWYIKKVCIRAWGIFIEKFGHPFPVLKHASGIDDKSRDYLLNVIKQIRMESGFTIPKEVELQMVEASGRSADIHEKALTWINGQIRKKIMGQTLTSDAGEKGARSLGQVHFDILQSYIEHLGKDVADKAVNQQIIQRLVDYNHPDVEDYPIFKFKPMVEDDITEKIKVYYDGIDRQVVKPIPEDEERIREFTGFPPRKVEETPAAAVADPTIPGDTGVTTKNIEVYAEADIKKYQEKIFTGVSRRKFTVYEESVDFAEIKSTTQSTQDKYIVKAGGIIKSGIDDMIRAIQRNKIVENKNYDAIKSLSFYADAVGALKGTFTDMLRETYENAMRQAKQEIINKKRRARRYSDVLKFQYDIDLRKINPTEALAFFDSKAFDMAGIERDNITKKVKVILYNSIKSGASLRDTINQIQTDTQEYYDAGQTDEDALKGYRLENVIRTNITEAMNEGRKAYFEDPALDGYVQAYQYSAILDNRVRPNHACMDGRIYSVTSPVWDRHTPPNGYNCRCLLIPVTQDEEYEESPMPPKSCDPDEGFDKPGM